MKKVFIDEYLTLQLRQQIDDLVDLNLDLDSILSLLSNNLYDYADYMVEQIKRYVMYIMWLADNQKDRSLAFEKYKKRTNQMQAENNSTLKTKKTTQQNDNSWTIDRFLSQLHKDRKRIDELSTLKPSNADQKQNEKIVALEEKKDKIDEILETLSDEELQKTLTQILQDDKDLSQTMKEAISTQFFLTPDDTQKEDEIQSPTAEKTKAKVEPTGTENQINEDKEDTVKPENPAPETDPELTTPDDDLGNETNTNEDSEPQTVETINEENETTKETDVENNQEDEETEIQEGEEDSDATTVDDQPVIDEEVNDETETSDDSEINESEKKSSAAESQSSEVDEELSETEKITETIQKGKDKIDEILDGLSDEEIQATLADILDNEEDLQKTIDETIQQLEANLASNGKDQDEENEDLPPTFSKKLADITFEDILSDPSIAKNRSTHTLFELDLEEDNGTQTLDDSLLFAEDKPTKKPGQTKIKKSQQEAENPESPTQKELDFVDEIAKKYGTDTLITVNIKKHDLSTSDLSLAEPLKTLKVGGIVWYKGREYVVEKIAMELDFFNHEQLMLTLNDLINHEEIKINAKKIK